MTYKDFVQELLSSPIIKSLTAALAGLFATSASLIMVIPIMWTLDFMSGMYAMKKSKKRPRFSNLRLNKCYDKMIVHILFLIGVTVLSNHFDAYFLKIWGFGFIVTTEFMSMVRNIYGHKQAAKIFKDLMDNAGLDIDEKEMGEYNDGQKEDDS